MGGVGPAPKVMHHPEQERGSPVDKEEHTTWSWKPHDDWEDASTYIDGFYKDRQRNHKQPEKQPEDTTMANKFLPFIVDKSTPEHVYRTLLSRSKGMNINLVTSIFYMVVEKGVTELRDFVKTLPENISVTRMYEEMIGKYTHYQIMDEELNKFIGIAPYMSAENWADIDDEIITDLDRKDTLAFLFVMWKVGKLSDYTTMHFAEYMEKSEDVLGSIPDYVKFSDAGETYSFNNVEDFKSWILYTALLRHPNEDELPPIRAVIQTEEEESAAPF
jgi:hypothetical protein